MAFLQPFAITVTNQAGSNACSGITEVWEGYACFCENYNGDGTNCDGFGVDYVSSTKYYQCLNEDEDAEGNPYNGNCHIEGGGEYLEVEVMSDCVCDNQPLGNICPTPDVREVTYSCGCQTINCGTNTFLDGGSPGDGISSPPYECPILISPAP